MIRSLFVVASLVAVAGPAAAASPADALSREIERYVRERAPVEPTSIEIPSLDAFSAAWEAPGNVHVVLSSGQQRFLGSVPVTITVYSDRDVVKRGVVTTRVLAQQSIYLTSRPMPRGALVHPDDVREERREVSSIPTGAALDRAEIVGQRTTRALPGGTIWRTAHLKKPQLVSRGQMVRLNFRSGALAIEGLGRARQDGRPGDRIRVMNVDSRREIVGIVTPAGEVDVAL